MYCEKCGSQNADNVSFCMNCGNQLTPMAQQWVDPVPGPGYDAWQSNQQQSVTLTTANKKEKKAKAKKNKDNGSKSSSNVMSKIIFVAIGLVAGIAIGIGLFMMISSGSLGASGKCEGKGFSSPEDAAKAYVEAFSSGDVNKMVSCFAVESSVENYEMADMIERFSQYEPKMNIRIPNYGVASKNINIGNKRSDIIKTITQHYYVLSGWEAPMMGMAIPLNGESPEDLLDEYFPDNEDVIVDGLEIEMIAEPEDIISEIWNNENNKAARKKMQKSYNAEDLASLGVVIHTEDGYYLWCAGLIKYNGKWYVDPNVSMLSSMMGIDSNHASMMYIGEDFDESMLSRLR